MLTGEQIKTQCSCVGIEAFEANFCFDEEIDVCLKSNKLEDLLKIAKNNGINTIFFAFAYADEDDYLILDGDILDEDEVEVFPECYDEYVDRFRREMYSFNERIDREIFRQPEVLCVYLLMSGIQVGIVQNNELFNMLPEKQNVLEKIRNDFAVECEKEYRKNLEKANELRKKVKEEILTQILKSDEWHQYTNQQLRRTYCQRLSDEYRQRYDVRVSTSEIYFELERIWNKYKTECRNKK